MNERLLEELSINALPALHTLLYDGWVLRFADGYTRRANSVSPLYTSSLPLEQKIAAVEALYQAQGLPPVFKLTPAHADLDAALDRRGTYVREQGAQLQVCNLSMWNASPPPLGWQSSQLESAWLEVLASWSSSVAEGRSVLPRMLRNLRFPACFVALPSLDAPAAVGLGVLERGYVGLYDIFTDPATRRQGWARAVISSILTWGRAHGAAHAYLQVMGSNTPAVTLYHTLGFRPLYSYWYRQPS